MTPESSRGPEDNSILGLDNVPLDLPLAGLGSRTLAASIDHLILFFFQLIWLSGVSALFGGLTLGGGWLVAVLMLGIFFLQWGYFAGAEIVMGGQTPGKAMVGLRVVSRTGGHTTAAAILIRNLMRNFDLLIGVPLMAIDSHFRRLGDFVAGTLVVYRQDALRPEVHLGRHPQAWGAQEIAVVENFLNRAPLMEVQSAEAMGQQLLDWIEKRDPVFMASVETTPGLEPVARLKKVLAVED